MSIWYIFGPFILFCGNLVYFPLFWYGVPSKIWQPCPGPEEDRKSSVFAPVQNLVTFFDGENSSL
jgi:hypothetical protein